MESISVVTITDQQLENHLEAATQAVMSFKFRAPGDEKAGKKKRGSATLRGRTVSYRPLQTLDGSTPLASAESTFSIADRIQQVLPKDELYTDVEHHVLVVLRRGVQVLYQICENYEQASGLDRLKASNRAGDLDARDEPELKAKLESCAAVGLFSMAAHVLAQLSEYQREAADRLSFSVDPPDELPLGRSKDAMHAGLYHFHRAMDAHAKDDASLVRAVREAARQLAERLRGMQHSLQHLDFFTRYHHRVEPEDVLIAGFELPDRAHPSQIQVVSKRPEEVVGNHVAKLETMRLAQRLACYDRELQRNPFVDLGGFVFTFIGDGSPGTGKTTLIQMIVTLLREYCAVAGLPLRYENFSIDEISDYQGRSGQNAKRFCQSVLDPRGVGFGTVDDIDQICGNRNDKNASAGQLEVTAVLMQEFAGPNTVVRGNTTFGLFSNYPEKVDDALRQRMQGRFLVDGPQTREDFTDLLYIFLEKDLGVPTGKGYEPLVTQAVRRVIEDKYEEYTQPQSPAVAKILEDVVSSAAKKGKLSTWRDFGVYLHRIQQHDERFTGRAVKNIVDSVRARMMAFDLPAEWFEDPEVFFRKPYETRVAMVGELRGELTPEIVMQEINRYADSEARYTDVAAERELEERTRQVVVDAKARDAARERLADES